MSPQTFLALPDLCRPGGAQRIPYPTLPRTPTLPYLRRQHGVDALQQVRTVVDDHLERDHVANSAHALVCACCPRPVHLRYREWLGSPPMQAKHKAQDSDICAHTLSTRHMPTHKSRPPLNVTQNPATLLGTVTHQYSISAKATGLM